MGDVDDFDEEGGGASGGVEDLDEGFVRLYGAFFARFVGEGREGDCRLRIVDFGS